MTTTYRYTTMESPLGDIILTGFFDEGVEGITGIYFGTHVNCKKMQNGIFDSKPFSSAIKQLEEYFEGKRRKFNLPLVMLGTPFQKKVWSALCEIDFGCTKSYGEIAHILNQPTASRAVGMANGKNPIGLVVPCHRVIGANGKLTGFAGGLDVKQWLLNHEAKFFFTQATN